MMRSLKLILSTQLKRSGINQTIRGFTLIELLAALILAVLVITPLMTFMLSILDSDRKEQAKVTSEQELQAALDYIARDLEQAIYIYDADGLTNNNNTTTVSSSGIQDQIPPNKSAPNCSVGSGSNASVCTPVLVFWKREFVANSVGVTSSTQTSTSQTNDGFTYSLVAYYLITNPNQTNTSWSAQARIGRFQIRGLVNATNANSVGTSADIGFNPPPLNANGTTLKYKMDQWVAASGNYTQRVETLVDYIYINTGTTGTNPPAGTCSFGQLTGNNVSGFYACVDSSDGLAQVYLRGNALARLQNNNLSYQDSIKNYFPSLNSQIQARGFLYTK